MRFYGDRGLGGRKERERGWWRKSVIWKDENMPGLKCLEIWHHFFLTWTLGSILTLNQFGDMKGLCLRKALRNLNWDWSLPRPSLALFSIAAVPETQPRSKSQEGATFFSFSFENFYAYEGAAWVSAFGILTKRSPGGRKRVCQETGTSLFSHGIRSRLRWRVNSRQLGKPSGRGSSPSWAPQQTAVK